jgi:hypothetical protein
MAKNQKPTEQKEKVFNMDLSIPVDMVPKILEMEMREEFNEGQRIGIVALGALMDFANGGIMLAPEELDRMVEATGIERPTCGEDIVALLSESTGMKEGKHDFHVTIDPVYMALYEEPARIQGRETGDLMQEIVDSVFDNDALGYLVSGTPRIMRMLEKDYQALKDLLGKDFDNGTDLARLVHKFFDGPMSEDDPKQLPEPAAVGGDL